MNWRFLAPFLALFAVSSGALAACPGAELAGVKDFTTKVLGAKSSKAIGINGYYRMSVGFDAACTPVVGIVKLGFNNVFFSREKLQHGNFRGRIYAVPGGDGASALLVDADLASDAGSRLSIGFTLIRPSDSGFGNGGVGFWRYVGSSWESAGMWGGLHWVDSNQNGAYAAPKKPKCDARIAGTGGAAAVGLSCNGFVATSASLDRALYALPAMTYGAAFSFDKIADAGGDGKGAFFDLCGHSESDNGGGGSPWLASRVIFSGNQYWEDQPISPTSAKTCRVKLERPVAPANRWQGGVQ